MTRHDRDMLLKAADGVAKSPDLTGLAAIIRRIVERQPLTDEPQDQAADAERRLENSIRRVAGIDCGF